MKQKLFSISSLLSLFAVSALMIGCADEFDNSSPAGEKPATVAEAEQLASYKTLVSYVDAANFHLANTLCDIHDFVHDVLRCGKEIIKVLFRNDKSVSFSNL